MKFLWIVLISHLLVIAQAAEENDLKNKAHQLINSFKSGNCLVWIFLN